MSRHSHVHQHQIVIALGRGLHRLDTVGHDAQSPHRMPPASCSPPGDWWHRPPRSGSSAGARTRRCGPSNCQLPSPSVFWSATCVSLQGNTSENRNVDPSSGIELTADCAAHLLDDPPGDRKAEARAAEAAIDRGIGLSKILEQPARRSGAMPMPVSDTRHSTRASMLAARMAGHRRSSRRRVR